MYISMPMQNFVLSIIIIPGVHFPAAISQEFQLQPPASILAVLGETTTIPCGPPTSIPPATVQWTKDHRLLFGDRFVINGNNLSVIDTQLSDRGVYYCTATNPLTLTSVTSQGTNITVRGELVLFILFPFLLSSAVGPLFIQLPSNITAPVTGSANFICQASGDPAPSIAWYRNQTLITGDAITVVLCMYLRDDLCLL